MTYLFQVTDVKELLDPMENENCLMKTKDWWTYEFCYGNEIRQYHMEGKLYGFRKCRVIEDKDIALKKIYQ